MSQARKKHWTKFVTRHFPRWVRQIECFFRGHSHPMFACCYCGRPSPMEFNPATGRFEYKS